jgi:prepilin-type N-terminal cleavage/methylation domain-containing protein
MKTPRQAGFTLIELLIVSIIVGILGTLVAMTYSGVRAEDRNKERRTAVKQVQGYLETYYAQNSKYPTMSELSDPNWRRANLRNISSDLLRDPVWNDKVTACTKDKEAVPAERPTEKCYSYQVTTAEGVGCDNSESSQCAQYTLTATLEGGDKYVKSSLN